MLWKMARKLALLFREGLSTAPLAAMQEEVARLPGNMANAISEARNILDEELQEKDRLQHSVQKYG